MEIKTIRNRLDNAELFDNAVNEALADGWRLTQQSGKWDGKSGYGGHFRAIQGFKYIGGNDQ